VILHAAHAPTEALLTRLRECHDDGAPELRASYLGHRVIVCRRDGSQPSLTESAHVRGWVAAHNISPI
jgi:hypothetical protein